MTETIKATHAHGPWYLQKTALGYHLRGIGGKRIAVIDILPELKQGGPKP